MHRLLLHLSLPVNGLSSASKIAASSSRTSRCAPVRRMAAFATAEMTSAHEKLVLACNVYISEGRDPSIIQQLQASARSVPGVALAHTFVDAPYHRTGFTLVSSSSAQLREAVVAVASSALGLLDLQRHSATHPRLGIVDHISVHLINQANAAGGQNATSMHSRGQLSSDSHYRSSSSSSSSDGEVQVDSNAVFGVADAVGCLNHAPATTNSAATTVAAAVKTAAAPSNIAALASAHAIDTTAAAAAAAAAPVTTSMPSAGAVAAATCAQAIGASLSSAPCHLPVYFYGWASPTARQLADIRRSLGYFKADSNSKPRSTPNSKNESGGSSSSSISGSSSQVWQGALDRQSADLSSSPPDLGPWEMDPKAGVVTIGALFWHLNYNVPLHPSITLAAGKTLARAVSQRGGGLPTVQAMALQHAGGSVEIACNLLDPACSSPADVQTYLEQQAASSPLVQACIKQELIHMKANGTSQAEEAGVRRQEVEEAVVAHESMHVSQHVQTNCMSGVQDGHTLMGLTMEGRSSGGGCAAVRQGYITGLQGEQLLQIAMQLDAAASAVGRHAPLGAD